MGHKTTSDEPAGENERAVQRVATRQPDSASKGNGTSRGCGATRSHSCNKGGSMGIGRRPTDDKIDVVTTFRE